MISVTVLTATLSNGSISAPFHEDRACASDSPRASRCVLYDNYLMSPTLPFKKKFWLCPVACKILVSQPGIKPMPPPLLWLRAQSLNHWTTREVPPHFLLLISSTREPWNWQNSPKCWAFQVALVIKDPPANAGDIRDKDSITGWGRSPGGRHGNPLQYSCLENLKDREAWWASVLGLPRGPPLEQCRMSIGWLRVGHG